MSLQKQSLNTNRLELGPKNITRLFGPSNIHPDLMSNRSDVCLVALIYFTLFWKAWRQTQSAYLGDTRTRTHWRFLTYRGRVSCLSWLTGANEQCLDSHSGRRAGVQGRTVKQR
jgi:hypothetical protein